MNTTKIGTKEGEGGGLYLADQFEYRKAHELAGEMPGRFRTVIKLAHRSARGDEVEVSRPNAASKVILGGPSIFHEG